MQRFEDPESTEFKAKLKASKIAYYRMIVDPFTSPIARPPSPFPSNSSLVRDCETFTLTVGPQGDFVGVFCPTLPLKSDNTNSSVNFEYLFASRVSNAIAYPTSYASLFSSVPSANWTGNKSSSSEHLPYMATTRLLAAQIRVRYIGRDDACSGIISVGSFVASIPTMATIFIDNAIQELRNPARVLPKEGAVVTWYPLDESDRDFQIVDQSRNERSPNLAIAFYGQGLPAGAVLDFELVRVYEYFPRPAYQELLGPDVVDITPPTKSSPVHQQTWLDFFTRASAISLNTFFKFAEHFVEPN